MATKITGTNTAAAPGVTGDDTDTGLFYGTNEIGFSTGGTSRMTLDSSGRLLLGTSTIGQIGEADALTVYQAGHTGITIRTGGTSNNTAIYFADGTTTDQNYRGAITYTHANDNLVFKTAAANRLRITSGGNLLLGTSTETNNLRLGNKFGIVGTAAWTGMSISQYAGTSAGQKPMIDFNRSRGTTDGSMTSVANGDGLGEIIFRGSDGTDFNDGAAIRAWVDGTPANDATDMPSRLTFHTSADGDTDLHERLRIDSSGHLLVGITSALGSNADDLCLSTAGNTGISIKSGTSSMGNIYFADDTSGVGLYRGYVSYNHSGDALLLGTANTTALSIDSLGNVAADIGNIVIGTAGKGISFAANAHAGGMTSELLDDYEEGTYTPAITDGGSNTHTYNATGRYTKIGRNVQCQFLLQFSGVGNNNHVKFNMPFTGLNNGALGGGVCIWSNLPSLTEYPAIVLAVQANTATIACHHGVDSDCTLGTNSYTNKAFYGVFQYEAA